MFLLFIIYFHQIYVHLVMKMLVVNADHACLVSQRMKLVTSLVNLAWRGRSPARQARHFAYSVTSGITPMKTNPHVVIHHFSLLFVIWIVFCELNTRQTMK